MNKLESILKCMLLLFVVGAFIVPSAEAIVVSESSMDPTVADETANFSVNFQLEALQGLVRDGKIKVVFPENEDFDISAANIQEYPTITLPADGGGEGVDENYTLVIDVPKRELVLVRDGTLSDYPQGTWITFILGNIVNPEAAGTKPIDVYTTVSNDNPIEQGSGTVVITAGPVSQFTLDQINNQVAGVSFGITVTAKDQFGNVAVDFVDVVNLSSTIGAIDPTTIKFNDGTLDGIASVDVTITKTGPGTVKAEYHGKLGTSNEFTVKPGVLHSLVIDNIASPKYDELPFTVTARAYDEFLNLNTSYDGTVDISAVRNQSDNRGITAVNLTPSKFAAGLLSVTVKVDVEDTNVPQPTYYDAGLYIEDLIAVVFNTSNSFNVSELPVDVKNSTVVAYPRFVPEDCNSESTITVTVKNALTQGTIPGATVSLASDRGNKDNIETINDVTDSEGKAKFEVSSCYTGSANFTATVKTKVLEQKANVYFGYDNMLHLAKDWNLVSVPRQLADSDINALSTTKVDRIYYYDAASSPKVWKYAIYDRANDTWSGTLTTIDDGKGYWMLASAVTDVPIVLKPIDPQQQQLPPEYPLKAGWNMIGYTSMELKPSIWTNEYLFSLTYPSGMPMWVSLYEWTGSGFRLQKPTNSDNVFITRGYWIYLTSDGVLVP